MALADSGDFALLRSGDILSPMNQCVNRTW